MLCLRFALLIYLVLIHSKSTFISLSSATATYELIIKCIVLLCTVNRSSVAEVHFGAYITLAVIAVFFSFSGIVTVPLFPYH